MASSKRLFAGRLFAGRLFAPALFRGVGAEAEVLQIEQIVGGWFIPGGTIGKRFSAGIVPTVESIPGQGFAAGAKVAEGRFQQ